VRRAVTEPEAPLATWRTSKAVRSASRGSSSCCPRHAQLLRPGRARAPTAGDDREPFIFWPPPRFSIRWSPCPPLPPWSPPGLISGAFSLTHQCVQLRYSPRVSIVHTSRSEPGQIYVPAVNTALMIGCLLLVVAFRSSTALGAAYGVAVTGTMAITTVLFGVLARRRWRWRLADRRGGGDFSSSTSPSRGERDRSARAAGCRSPSPPDFPAHDTWNRGTELLGRWLSEATVALRGLSRGRSSSSSRPARARHGRLPHHSCRGRRPSCSSSTCATQQGPARRSHPARHQDGAGAPRWREGERVQGERTSPSVSYRVWPATASLSAPTWSASSSIAAPRESSRVRRDHVTTSADAAPADRTPQGMMRWRKRLFSLIVAANASSAADFFSLPPIGSVELERRRIPEAGRLGGSGAPRARGEQK